MIEFSLELLVSNRDILLSITFLANYSRNLNLTVVSTTYTSSLPSKLNPSLLEYGKSDSFSFLPSSNVNKVVDDLWMKTDHKLPENIIINRLHIHSKPNTIVPMKNENVLLENQTRLPKIVMDT